jgi:hypothetical protein
MKHKLVRRVVALALSFTLVLALFAAPVTVVADDDAIYSIPTFTGLGTTSDGQFLDGYGIQRMTWNHEPKHGAMGGTTIAVSREGTLVVSGGAEASGIQFSENWANQQMFQGVTGNAYRVVMEASSTRRNGTLRIIPDNHPQEVWGTFDITTTPQTYELSWVQVQHVHNNLQISANVAWQVHSIFIYEIDPSEVGASTTGTSGGEGGENGATAEGGVYWTLAGWLEENGFSEGDAVELPEDEGAIERADSTIVVAADGAILVTPNRALNWQGVSISIPLIGIEVGDEVSVTVRRPAGVDSGAILVARQRRINWDQPSWEVSPALRAGESHTFTFTMTPAHMVTAIPGDWATDEPEGIRIRHEQLPDGANGVVSAFYVTDITISRGGGGGGTVEPPAPVIPPNEFPAGVIYSFLHDNFVAALDQGDTVALGTGIVPMLVSSGSGTYTVVGNPYGGNAIRVSGRVNDYDAFDLAWRSLELADGEYTIQVVGHVDLSTDNAAAFTVAGTTSPFGWISEEEFPDEDTGEFELVQNFSVIDGAIHGDDGPIGGGIRIFTAGFTNTYTVYQIAVVPAGGTLPALPARVDVPPVAEAAVIVLVIGNTSAQVNASTMILEAAPFISSDNRTMVPVRFVADAMGAVTDWDQASRTVTITPPTGAAITLTVGEALPGGMGTPEIVNNRTFVPVAFVATSMGGEVAWEAATQTVIIGLGGAAAAAPAPAPVVPFEAPDPIEGGIFFSAEAWGDAGSGVSVIIGRGIDAWPYAYGGGEVAFEPVAGETYRLTFNVTSLGATGWRVRWVTSGGQDYPNYTSGDRAVVNDFPFAQGTVANVIPAHFNSGFSADGTYDLVVDITLDGNETLDNLIGNITLRGSGGSPAWQPNSLTIEHNGAVVASWTMEQQLERNAE